MTNILRELHKDNNMQESKHNGRNIMGIVLAAAIGAGALYCAREVYRGYTDLRTEALGAIARNDQDAARKAILRSDSTDMGCLRGGLYHELQRTANQD